MYKSIAISAPSFLVAFIRDRYLPVLTAAKCPCSEQAVVCLSTTKSFESATQGVNLNLEDLEMGLFKLNNALKKNKDSIENKAIIRSFLEQLRTELGCRYSCDEITDPIELINASLKTLA